MRSTAVLFPGQGSLTADSADFARSAWPELADAADDLVGGDPFARAAESTAYAQPAIYVTSLAGWRAKEIDPGEVVAMAGHSLGELSALAAAGALDPFDALRLVVIRGRLMADAAAAAQHEGGMVALLGGTPEAASALAARCGLTIANDNAPGQLVLSGDRIAIETLTSVARDEGFKALVLDVAGAFHSPGVAVAEDPWFAALQDVEWRTPLVPVVSGYTAQPFEDVPTELARAVVNKVRWREVMATLYELGAREFVDVGPGRVLARLVARNPVKEETRALSR